MSKTYRFLTVVGVLTAAGLSGLEAQEKRRDDAAVTAWVAQRVKEWQPTGTERRFDDIGWVDTIGAALRLGQQQQRPIFLFTHDGRMAIGRC